MTNEYKQKYYRHRVEEFIYEDEVFPLEVSFEGINHKKYDFFIFCEKFPETGFLVTAIEKDNIYEGFEFASSNLNDPNKALDELRLKIKTGLQTKYLKTVFDSPSMIGSSMIGRVGYSDRYGGVFIVDGQPKRASPMATCPVVHSQSPHAQAQGRAALCVAVCWWQKEWRTRPA